MSTTMVLNLILGISMYPIVLILFLVQKGSVGKEKDKKLFGIACEEEWLSTEQRAEILKRYQRTMKRYLILLLLFPVVIFPIPYMSISLTMWCAWIYAGMILCVLPYMREYGNLYAYKQRMLQEKEKFHGDNSSVQYTEIKSAGKVRTVRLLDFLPQGLFSILATGIAFWKLYHTAGSQFVMLIGTFAVCTLVFWLCAVWADGMKTTVISYNSDVNVNYSRAKKQILKHYLCMMAWVNTLFVWVALGTILAAGEWTDLSYSVIVWGSIVEGVILLGVGYLACKKNDALELQYNAQKDLENEGEEKNWIGGIFYHNPKDRHTMVPKRVGVGTTCNLATPGGKVFVIVAILGLLIAPISCVWAMVDEFTPISLTCQNQVITARQVKKDYEIPVDSIVHISMQEEVPQGRRMKGTGMDNLLKGTFNNREEGRVQFFLNPQNHVFLRVETEDQIYYLGGYDDAQTREVYAKIGDL